MRTILILGWLVRLQKLKRMLTPLLESPIFSLESKFALSKHDEKVSEHVSTTDSSLSKAYLPVDLVTSIEVISIKFVQIKVHTSRVGSSFALDILEVCRASLGQSCYYSSFKF